MLQIIWMKQSWNNFTLRFKFTLIIIPRTSADLYVACKVYHKKFLSWHLYFLKIQCYFILFFFSENVFLYKKVYNSRCNISTLKESEGKTKFNLGFILALPPRYPVKKLTCSCSIHVKFVNCPFNVRAYI